MVEKIIQDLSSTGRHQECLDACLQLLASEPENPFPWKFAGKSLLALGQFEKAQHHLTKAHQLDTIDPETIKDIGNIFLALQSFTEAKKHYEAALYIDKNYAPAINNLGLTAKRQGDLAAAAKLIKKASDLDQSFAPYHMNLGGIYKDLGDLDKALNFTLKAHNLEPDNLTILINLAGIYKDLGELDKALNFTLKAHKLEPKASKALYLLGTINMAEGKIKEARQKLLSALAIDPQEYGAYYELSRILETSEEAEELIKSINLATTPDIIPEKRYFIEFAISNCLHKSKKYAEASKHLQTASRYKLAVLPSNLEALRRAITDSLSDIDPRATITVNTNHGMGRIFIVGMPRSGSTLLETILSLNPAIKCLGERISLTKAIAKFQQQHGELDHSSLDELYSQMEPINDNIHKFTTDKNLYNFIHINWIINHMPKAKIIHCDRNPMDNILSMYRSNLMAGNNYTASLEDSAKVLIAQKQAMQIQKKRHPKRIFTFNYEQFVNSPEVNLRKLLEWLGLEFNEHYLHPEKSARSVNTASVIQARKPISNKSVGGWRNYENLLQPAMRILQENGIQAE